jgi:hypothetical protein
MEKLISMTDFICHESSDKNMIKMMEPKNNKGFVDYWSRTFGYANFLKQPLTLGMFVPVDEKGNVLEEPYILDPDHYSSRIEYKKAKNRCLFEGINYIVAKKEGHYSRLTISGLSPINYPEFWEGVTVENLIRYNLKLTLTAQKQIGLI